MNTTDIYSLHAEWTFFLYLGSSFKSGGVFLNLIRAQEILCTLQLDTKERTFILKSSSQFQHLFKMKSMSSVSSDLLHTNLD